MGLILSISPDNVKPYKFKITGISVYSLEEALYHAYKYWKESLDDFVSDEFISWVNYELSLSYIASKIRDIALIPQLSKKITAFLSVIEYFDEQELTNLKAELVSWENRFEWEKFKERGDNLISLNQPDRAFVIYKKALSYGDNSQVLNNAGISLMKMGIYGEAVEYFEKAYALDTENFKIITNLAEAYIFNTDYEKAEKLLNSTQRFGENSDICYLYGELNFALGKYVPSLEFYEKAILLKDDPHYMYRVTDVYIKLRLYDKAIANLYMIEEKDKKVLIKLAEVYISSNNVPAAARCIDSAISIYPGSARLWTMLARCRRLDYDLDGAQEAVEKAIELEADNEYAHLELARIKKAQGKTREYQMILHKLLNTFKNKERERNYGTI